MLTETQRLAQQQATQSRADLQKQLADQRNQMQANRAQLAEQTFLQQKQINQQAASRGLGSSGLRNLAGLQAQLAQSGALNTLARTDAEVQKEAMDANRGVQQTLTDSLRQAQLTNAEQNVNADTELYEREKSEEQRKSDFMLQIAQLAADGANDGLLRSMIELAGYSADDLTESGGSLMDAISGVNAPDTSLEGYGVERESSWWKKAYTDVGGWLAGWLADDNSQRQSEYSAANDIKDYAYNIGGSKYKINQGETIEQFQNRVMTELKAQGGFKYLGQGVNFQIDPDNGRAYFVNAKTGKEYSTYLQAYNAFKGE